MYIFLFYNFLNALLSLYVSFTELSIINPVIGIKAFLGITIAHRVIILFHEKLKYLREQQELSQKELCSRLGLPTSTYCRYESGETQPTLTTLKLIANFFDVTVDYLLDNQIFTENELVDLQSFLENGNYTIFGKFPTHKDRQKLAAMLNILFK